MDAMLLLCLAILWLGDALQIRQASEPIKLPIILLSASEHGGSGLLAECAIAEIFKQHAKLTELRNSAVLLLESRQDNNPPSILARNLQALFLSLFTIVVIVFILHQVAYWGRKLRVVENLKIHREKMKRYNIKFSRDKPFSLNPAYEIRANRALK